MWEYGHVTIEGMSNGLFRAMEIPVLDYAVEVAGWEAIDPFHTYSQRDGLWLPPPPEPEISFNADFFIATGRSPLWEDERNVYYEYLEDIDEGPGMLLEELLDQSTLDWLEKKKAGND